MRRYLIIVMVACFCILPTPVHAISWDEVIDTQAEHDSNIPGTNHPHFTTAWRTTDTWDGSEGYYRWTVTGTSGEDDDGYAIQHPNTGSNSVYLSWIMRIGPDLSAAHAGQGWKFVLFYPVDESPRPTVFDQYVRDNGAIAYYVFQPGTDANGEGAIDEFGSANPTDNYPSHTFPMGSVEHTQWYFCVAGIVGDYVKTYIYGQDGVLTGQYAVSQVKSGGFSETWDYARLLAYIEATTGQGAGGYVDICHISVHNSLPSPPSGFVGGSPTYECSDRVDNDGDGAIDFSGGDTGCADANDDDETDCGDGVCEEVLNDCCNTCPADCPTGAGEVCCSGVIYTGDCCVNEDCSGGQVCSGHTCQAAPQSGIFFTEDFEDNIKNTFLSDWYGSMMSSQWTIQSQEVANGQYSARHNFPVGSTEAYVTQHIADSIAGPVEANLSGETLNELFVQYKIMFSQNYDFSNSNTKQLIIGTQDSRRHDEPCCNPWVSHYYLTSTGTNGELYAEKNSKFDATGPPYMGNWSALSPNINGYGPGSNFYINDGQWYTIEVHSILNDPNQNNGVFEMWVDGLKVGEYLDVSYRVPWDGTQGDDFNYGTNFIMLSNNIGSGATQDQDVYYDDIKFSTSYIGTSQAQTCQNQGYQCCDACQSGPHQEYDDDCPGQACCEECSVPTQSCSDLGGACCSSGQPCQGGSFQSSSDCSLCCVGGVCQAPSEIIIDNLDPEFTTSGGWWESGYPDPYGTNSLGSNVNEGSTAIWTPTIAQAGIYEVYAWWTAGELRASDARYTINHAQGSEEVQVNQLVNGGNWNLLGSYSFNAGTSGSIVLSDTSNDLQADAVCADAVRFVYIGIHRADTNPQDGCIDLSELLAFIKRWKVSSRDVGMPEVMEAMGLWKSGTGCG